MPFSSHTKYRKYYKANKKKMLDNSKRHYELNRTKIADRRAKYYKTNKDEFRRRHWAWRAKEKGATIIEAITPQAIYDRDGGKCHLCRRAVAYSTFELDHIIPLKCGGQHTYENTAIAHRRCNLKKRHTGPSQLRIAGFDAIH